jgi:glutamate dehydrogenase
MFLCITLFPLFFFFFNFFVFSPFSSKKGAGINHKEFGVTSEGVVVYLVTALKRVLNIDPAKQPFSVKITGGPDGDVAGNLIRILFRSDR